MLSLAALLAFGSLQGTTPPPRPAPNAILATVDGAPITAAEVEPYLWALKSREVVEELVGHRMVAAEAARKNIVATDAEVQARVQDQIANIKTKLQPGQTFESVLEGPVGGMARLNLVARSSVLVDKLAELDFKPAEYVKVATILFRTAGDSTDALSQSIRAADSAYAALTAGKPWNSVLRLHEKNSDILANDGLIGWKLKSLFPASVQTQFETVKPLGFTKPTQTSNGIQIFRLITRGSDAPPAELADLKTQYIAGARQGVVAKLREKAKIEIK